MRFKRSIKAILKKAFNRLGLDVRRMQTRFSADEDESFVSVSLFEGFHGLAPIRHVHFTTYKATEYIVKNRISGDFVECGVYQGQQVMVMALTLLRLGDTSRNLYLYDTFAGMTKPSKHDFSQLRGQTYEQTLEKWENMQRDGYNLWGYASIESVRENLATTGYPMERVHFVKGDILETIPNDFHSEIALLRLDTDFYNLTKHELVHFYKLLSKHGILILDDYVTWDGARKAVDEFFSDFDPFSSFSGLFGTGGDRVILKTNF